MTSASTKRRSKRSATPKPVGMPGLASEFMREMMKPPGQEDYAAAYRRASGRAPAEKDAEIQRLRAAMVNAIDDCEAALRYPDLPANTRAWIRRAAVGLKAALEKK